MLLGDLLRNSQDVSCCCSLLHTPCQSQPIGSHLHFDILWWRVMNYARVIHHGNYNYEEQSIPLNTMLPLMIYQITSCHFLVTGWTKCYQLRNCLFCSQIARTWVAVKVNPTTGAGGSGFLQHRVRQHMFVTWRAHQMPIGALRNMWGWHTRRPFSHLHDGRSW